MAINRQKLSPYNSGTQEPVVDVGNVVRHLIDIDGRSARLSVTSQVNQEEVTNNVIRGLVGAEAIGNVEAAFVFRAFGTVQYYLSTNNAEPDKTTVKGIDELNERLVGFYDEFGPEGAVAVEYVEHRRGYMTAHAELLGTLATIASNPEAPYLLITGVGTSPTLRETDSAAVDLPQNVLAYKPASFRLNSRGVFVPEADRQTVRRPSIAADSRVAIDNSQLPL